MSHPQQILNLVHKVTYEASDFFVSSTNELAFAWIESWPEWPNHCLILHGPKGCGKTHLSHLWLQKSGAVAVQYEDLKSMNLDDLCQSQKALLVDDVPAELDESLMFHLYNAVQQANGYLLLTSHSCPQNWDLQLPDLRSRVQAAMVAEIRPADDVLLKAMIRKVFADEQVMVADPIVDYLLQHLDRSFEVLFGSIKKINTYALATKRKITLPLVKEVL